ncbi:MAG: hypothetical protein IJ105_03985 [Bacilli bacterium]|nr:hypothetical protein [Bacilli bacterium]
MNKNQIYRKKKELIGKIKLKSIDDKSKELLKKLGFSVKYDRDYNMYIFDDINNERMYTNTIFVSGKIFKISENNYYSLEFSISNRHINNIRLYKKENGKKLIYKKK